jgi:hypothetical protein
MRREPLLPRNLTRFNYWDYARVKPTPPGELGFDSAVGPSTHERFRQAFASHLRDGECGKRWCPWDAKMTDAPKLQWSFRLLECYIRMDREWRTDQLAWRIFRDLPTDAQTRLRMLDQTQRRQCHRGWDRILEIIARDQRVFRYIIEQKRSGRMGEVGDQFDLAEGSVQRIYAAYHAQATRLLGKARLLDQLAKKRSMTEIVARLKRRDAARPNQTQPAPPVCQTWDDVFAWFALALRNLKRYRLGHPPLPWTPAR